MKLDIQMFADGKVVIQTELDTKNFQKGLDRMQNTAKGAGTSIKSIVAGLGIAKLISTAFNIIRNSMDGAIQRIDTFNQYPKVLSNFGVSAEEASKSIKRIDKSVRGLPTSLDQAVGGVQNLFMVTKDLPKAEKLFKAVNDSAMVFANGSTEAVDRFSYAFKQAMSSGKVSAQDFNQMNEAIPGLMDKVAESMGKTYRELKEGLSDGSISMEDFNNALLKLDTEGGAGMKALEQSAKSATGGIKTSIQNAKTAITRGVANMIEGLNKGLKKANLGSLSEIIAKVGKAFEKQLNKIGELLSKIDFNKLINAFKTLAPAVLGVISALMTYKLIMKGITLFNITKNIISTATAFFQLIPAIRGVKDAVTLLSMAFNANPIGLIITAVVGLIAVLAILYKKSETFRNFVNGIFEDIKNAVMKVYNEIKPTIDKFIKTLQKSFKDVMKQLSSAWKKIKPAMQQLMTALGQLFEALEPIVSFILDLAIKRLQWIINLWTFLVPIIAKTITVVTQVITAIVTGIVNFVTAIVNFFTVTIPNAFNSFVDFFKNLPENIGYLLGSLLGIIASFFVKLVLRFVEFITKDVPNFINGIVTWFTELPGKIWTWLSQLPTKISDAINSMKDKATKKIPEFIDHFKEKMSKLPDKIKKIGEDVVKGLWKGIKGSKDWIGEKIGKFCNDIVKGFKDHFKIKSPSRVMRDEIGKNLALGIGVGFGNEIDDVYKKMRNAIDIENAKISTKVETGKVFNSLVATTPINVNLNAGVELDGQKVGRLITPEVSRTIKSGGGI